MSPQRELMENIKTILEQDVRVSINLDELTKDGRVYAELGPGTTVRKYLRTGTGVYSYPVLFMFRNADDSCCIDKLSAICNHLKSRRKLPDGEKYQFCGLKVASEPHITGRLQDGQKVYACIVNFEIYY